MSLVEAQEVMSSSYRFSYVYNNVFSNFEQYTNMHGHHTGQLNAKTIANFEPVNVGSRGLRISMSES